jgi:hypothetical protein
MAVQVIAYWKNPAPMEKNHGWYESEVMKKFGISEFQQKTPNFCNSSTGKEFLQVRANSVVRNFRTTAPHGKEFDKSTIWGRNTRKNVCTYSHVGVNKPERLN